MRKLIAIILIGIGIAEMIWGKLWGRVRIKTLEGGMYTSLGLQDAEPAVSRAFNQYIRKFGDMWMVVFWFGLATTILGIMLLLQTNRSLRSSTK